MSTKANLTRVKGWLIKVAVMLVLQGVAIGSFELFVYSDEEAAIYIPIYLMVGMLTVAVALLLLWVAAFLWIVEWAEKG